MSTEKRHFYIAHASFKEMNLSHDIDQQYNTTIDLNTNRITKALLEKIRLHMLNDIKNDFPNVSPTNFRLNSISYLGEMTKEEFES